MQVDSLNGGSQTRENGALMMGASRATRKIRRRRPWLAGLLTLHVANRVIGKSYVGVSLVPAYICAVWLLHLEEGKWGYTFLYHS